MQTRRLALTTPAFLAVLTLLVLYCAGTRAATPAQAWRIDEAHTWIGFKIDAVGFPTTHGYFNRYSGRILIDFDHPAKNFTSFTVDSASVDLGSQYFNDFVKSRVLLNVENFPTLSFTLIQAEKVDPRTRYHPRSHLEWLPLAHLRPVLMPRSRLLTAAKRTCRDGAPRTGFDP